MADSSHSTTLTDQAVGVLQRMLEAGELGEPLPSERQLAQLFGISRITLRRSLAMLEERGVVRREQGRGTYYDAGPAMANVESLVAERHPSLVVLVDQKSDRLNPQLTPWTWRVCCEMMPALEKSQTPLRFMNDERFLAAIARGELSREHVVGFVAPTHRWNTANYEAALKAEMPWVGLGRTSASMFWNIIDPDWAVALEQAIEDLAPTPEDRVFFPTAPYPDEIDQQRWLQQAFTMLDRRGVRPDKIVVRADGPYESHGYLAMRWYLKEYGRPSLVLSTFDLGIAGAYRALQSHCDTGLAGVRFLGAADLEIGRRLTPSLSTLSLDYAGLAQRILTALEEQRVNANPVPLHHESAFYIPRASSRASRSVSGAAP